MTSLFLVIVVWYCINLQQAQKQFFGGTLLFEVQRTMWYYAPVKPWSLNASSVTEIQCLHTEPGEKETQHQYMYYVLNAKPGEV